MSDEKIFIISNRSVSEDGQTFVGGADQEALPTFRIARCKVEETTVSYDILPDMTDTRYDFLESGVRSGDLRTAQLKGTAATFYELYEDMVNNTTRKGDVLFFIHGFAYKLEENLKHIRELHRTYIEPANSPIKHLIYVCWPTVGGKVGTYKDDQADAIATGQMLGRVFDKLRRFFVTMFEQLELGRCPHKVHLAAHSMGNTVLREMLDALPSQRLFPLFGEVLLFNSDVEDDVFEPGRPFTKLEHLAERTHMYIHRSDDALRISRFTKNWNKRLGLNGPRSGKNLNDETFVIDTTATKAHEDIMERVIDHSGYLERDTVVKHIMQVLQGRLTSEIKSKPSAKHANYFLLED